MSHYHGGAKEVRISEPQSDELSGRPLAISHEHAKVHEGMLFVASHAFSTVPVGGVVKARFKTGAKSCRALVGIGSAGPASVSMFEGSTFSVGGTPVLAVNRNRSSTEAPTAEVYHTPTVSASGTAILQDAFSDGSATLSEARGFGFEWVFKPNTEHYLAFTNVDGKDMAMGVTFNWYEV